MDIVQYNFTNNGDILLKVNILLQQYVSKAKDNLNWNQEAVEFIKQFPH